MRVLLLGDSHTHGSYGSALESLFKKAGHTVTRVGWVSANAQHYLNGTYKKLKLGHTGDFDADVKGKSFDVAIVSLGTNDAAGAGSDAASRAAAANIKKLADSIRATKVYWVGPPSFDPDAARKYNASFATDDLNARAARMWSAGSDLFGTNAIDPRPATKAFTGTMKPTAKMPKGDIHFQRAGGEAWAKFVFAAVLPADVAAVEKVREKSSTPASTGGGTFPVLPIVGGALVLGLAVLWFRAKRKS